MAKSSSQSMQELVDKAGMDLVPLKLNSLVEVTILSKSRNKIIVDVGGLTIGFIPDKEFSSDVYELKPHDKILACVLAVENDDGFAVLSLKRAEKDRLLQSLSDKFASQENVTVSIKQANRGGLLVEFGNIEGFLPASQLSNSHYPKVGDDKEKILGKLNELVGQNLQVKILNFDPGQGKLIFSEKAAVSETTKEKLKNFQPNQIIEAKVSGVADFGVFVDLDGIEGLVHISEISWDRVKDLRSKFKVGDKIRVMVIAVENSKISLSVKRLESDPWEELIKEYKKDDVVRGIVTRITPFGAFVELKKYVTGLVHVSELSEKIKKAKLTKIEDIFTISETYSFKINNIDPANHKINLVLAEEKDKKTKNKDKVVKTKKTKAKTLKTS